MIGNPLKADEWRNFAGSYETMQADIEQLKTQIQTPESDPAKAIDLATQIIAQARFHYLVPSY